MSSYTLRQPSMRKCIGAHVAAGVLLFGAGKSADSQVQAYGPTTPLTFRDAYPGTSVAELRQALKLPDDLSARCTIDQEKLSQVCDLGLTLAGLDAWNTKYATSLIPAVLFGLRAGVRSPGQRSRMSSVSSIRGGRRMTRARMVP